MGGHINFVLGC